MLPEYHRLAKKASIKLSALGTEHWVSLSDAFFPGRREFLRNTCAASGFDPQIVSEVDSLSVMLGAVSSGEGVALVPMHARKIPHAGCTFIKLSPPVPMSDLLLVLPHRPPEVELKTLIALITERAAALNVD